MELEPDIAEGLGNLSESKILRLYDSVGWRLELSVGWHVVMAERTGDYTVGIVH